MGAGVLSFSFCGDAPIREGLGYMALEAEFGNGKSAVSFLEGNTHQIVKGWGGPIPILWFGGSYSCPFGWLLVKGLAKNQL